MQPRHKLKKLCFYQQKIPVGEERAFHDTATITKATYGTEVDGTPYVVVEWFEENWR